MQDGAQIVGGRRAGIRVRRPESDIDRTVHVGGGQAQVGERSRDAQPLTQLVQLAYRIRDIERPAQRRQCLGNHAAR